MRRLLLATALSFAALSFPPSAGAQCAPAGTVNGQPIVGCSDPVAPPAARQAPAAQPVRSTVRLTG